MKKNMGKADKIIRLVIAMVIGILNYTGVLSGTIGIVLMLLAIVFIVTSFLNFCPLYTIFGLNTCTVKDKK